MTAPWWAAFQSAETVVSCGDTEHRVRWADGTLQPLDHPDAEAELVLAALGGETTECLDLCRAWGKHAEDLAVLALAPRSAADRLSFTADILEEISAPGITSGWAAPSAFLVALRARALAVAQSTKMSRAFRRSGGRPAPFPVALQAAVVRAIKRRPAHVLAGQASSHGGGLIASSLLAATSEGRDPRREMFGLLALGEAFQLRLAGTVAHAWSAEGAHGSSPGRALPALTAALTGRLAPAAAQWVNLDPGQIEAAVHSGTGWGEVTLDRAPAGERLRARLPVAWLAAVWAPGLAVVGGHLVVGVKQVGWPTATVLALRQPGSEPVELAIRHDGHGWRRTA